MMVSCGEGVDAPAKKASFFFSRHLVLTRSPGYERAKLRSIKTRSFIRASPSGTPGAFWPAVDRVAAQTTLLLLPLVNNVLGPHTPAALASFEAFHQRVHSIVATAG
jgi:hypothetical protein